MSVDGCYSFLCFKPYFRVVFCCTWDAGNINDWKHRPHSQTNTSSFNKNSCDSCPQVLSVTLKLCVTSYLWNVSCNPSVASSRDRSIQWTYVACQFSKTPKCVANFTWTVLWRMCLLCISVHVSWIFVLLCDLAMNSATAAHICAKISSPLNTRWQKLAINVKLYFAFSIVTLPFSFITVLDMEGKTTEVSLWKFIFRQADLYLGGLI